MSSPNTAASPLCSDTYSVQLQLLWHSLLMQLIYVLWKGYDIYHSNINRNSCMYVWSNCLAEQDLPFEYTKMQSHILTCAACLPLASRLEIATLPESCQWNLTENPYFAAPLHSLQWPPQCPSPSFWLQLQNWQQHLGTGQTGLSSLQWTV